MFTQSLAIRPDKLFAPALEKREFDKYVKPPLLIAYGLMANALFWSGLMMPYNEHSALFVAYLHVVSILLGFAMAWGGSMATLMLIEHKKTVPVRSMEFVAGLLNLSVLTAAAVLMLAAYSVRL